MIRSDTSNAGIASLSAMVYGTWRMLDDQPSLQDINRRLNRCVELGIPTLDTAKNLGRDRGEEGAGGG